jgi:hypothetical protein
LMLGAHQHLASVATDKGRSTPVSGQVTGRPDQGSNGPPTDSCGAQVSCRLAASPKLAESGQADRSSKNKREAKGPSVVSFRLFAAMPTGEQPP